MVSIDSSYANHATRHQTLLKQFNALVEFKKGVFGYLSREAMASTLHREIEATRKVKAPRLTMVLSEARTLAAAADIVDPPTLRGIDQYLRSVAASARRLTKASKTLQNNSSRKSPSELHIERAIARRRAKIEKGLREIPASIEKAWAALAHEIHSDDDGPPDALCAFGMEIAKAQFKANVAHRRQALLSGNAMMVSARGYEPYWYTSYLRYYETFEAKDARALLLSEARDFEDQMHQFAAAVDSEGNSAAYELPHFLDLMFAHAQCRTVRNILFRMARRAVPSVIKWQKLTGAWCDWLPPAREANPALEEDSETTSLAIVFLARYASIEERAQPFARGQKWLVQAQLEDGSWVAKPTSGSGLPISTTVRVLEALRQTSIPADHPAVQKGESFLMDQQQAPGLWWEKSARWQTHITAQVLEYFRSRTERPGDLDTYLRSARTLLIKSEQLTLSEDPADVPLAMTAAYHGLEHFLYGCLLRMDSNEPIFADTKGSTIGFNAAFGAFERVLKEKGMLGANVRLPYRQQLQQLGTKRDMFIHRAELISVGDAFSLVAICRSFVERYDMAVLGFRFLD